MCSYPLLKKTHNTDAKGFQEIEGINYFKTSDYNYYILNKNILLLHKGGG
jgi:hypothetical protein